jgi:hypothetical protein
VLGSSPVTIKWSTSVVEPDNKLKAPGRPPERGGATCAPNFLYFGPSSEKNPRLKPRKF